VHRVGCHQVDAQVSAGGAVHTGGYIVAPALRLYLEIPGSPVIRGALASPALRTAGNIDILIQGDRAIRRPGVIIEIDSSGCVVALAQSLAQLAAKKSRKSFSSVMLDFRAGTSVSSTYRVSRASHSS